MTLLHCEIIGTGRPLIFLHGFLGDSSNWRSIAKEFMTDYQCFLIDLRNHGRSFHAPSHTYPELAHDVAELLEHLALKDSIILGHSMGAKVAMHLAHDFPNLVSNLVMVDMAPKSYPTKQQFVVDALCKIDLKKIRTRAELQMQLVEVLTETDLVAFLLKGIRQAVDGAWHWQFNLEVLRSQYANICQAPQIDHPASCPSLWLCGADSRYVLLTDREAIFGMFPNATFATIAAAGHWVHVDQPVEFVSVLSNYLGKKRSISG